MDLNDAHALVTVAKHGSFTAAAKILGSPKATVSRRVSRLEDAIGVRLLHRTTRRVSLTEAGASYVERAQRALDDLAEAERAATNTRGKPSGVIRMSAPFDFARDHLAEMMPALRRAYPDLRLHVELTQRRVDLVAEGFDLALRGGTLPDSELGVRKLADSGVALCASPKYLAKHGTPKKLEDLASHPFFGMAGLVSASRVRLVGPRGPVEAEVNPWLLVNEWGVLRHAVLDGLGIGLLEVFNVRADLASGKVRRVLPTYGLPGGGLYALFPSARHVPHKVRVFVDFLIEQIRMR
jgi:DNA-binding transcriptional LysR family regulator